MKKINAKYILILKIALSFFPFPTWPISCILLLWFPFTKNIYTRLVLLIPPFSVIFSQTINYNPVSTSVWLAIILFVGMFSIIRKILTLRFRYLFILIALTTTLSVAVFLYIILSQEFLVMPLRLVTPFLFISYNLINNKNAIGADFDATDKILTTKNIVQQS